MTSVVNRPIDQTKGPSRSVWLILRSGLVGLPWSADQIDGLLSGENWMAFRRVD